MSVSRDEGTCLKFATTLQLPQVKVIINKIIKKIINKHRDTKWRYFNATLDQGEFPWSVEISEGTVATGLTEKELCVIHTKDIFRHGQNPRFYWTEKGRHLPLPTFVGGGGVVAGYGLKVAHLWGSECSHSRGPPWKNLLRDTKVKHLPLEKSLPSTEPDPPLTVIPSRRSTPINCHKCKHN